MSNFHDHQPPAPGQAHTYQQSPLHNQSAPPQQGYEPPSQDDRTWTCSRCSLINHPAASHCEKCETSRQAAAMPPAQSFPPPPQHHGFGQAPNATNFAPPPQRPGFGGAPDAGSFAPPPQRHGFRGAPDAGSFAPPPQRHGFGGAPDVSTFAPPPQRYQQTWAEDDLNNPLHYTRDPEKLVAYIIPLPMPALKQAPVEGVPRRFLIYTPPPPPLSKPQLAPGEKENKVHLAQRKWQEQVKTAKTSNEKVTSFKGIHHRMVKGANKAIGLTTSSNLDFLGRVSPSASPGGSRPSTPERLHADDGVAEGHETKKTVGVKEIVFMYPHSMGTDETALREEFINTLMRTKSKAERDSVIATGLVPVGFGIDIMLVVVGGLGEIATAWAFKSIMGAKTARSMTKRLSSSSNDPNAQLKLTFQPSNRIEIMKDYVRAECHRIDAQQFPDYHTPPTESQIVETIGWSPSQTGGETKNWEDEQWELTEVKEDFRLTIHKGSKEWKKYCSHYDRDWVKEQDKKLQVQAQQQGGGRH